MVTDNVLVTRYLAELERAAVSLPPGRREELVDQIRDHLDAALAEAETAPGDAGLRVVLDRLGAPDEIVRAEIGELSPTPPKVSTRRELAAAVLMTLGSFVVPVIGWLVGAALLWTSSLLRLREKILATLLVPGGAGLLLIVGGLAASSCSTTTTSANGGPTVVVADTCAPANVLLQRLEIGAAVLALIVALVLPVVLYVVARRRADRQELLTR